MANTVSEDQTPEQSQLSPLLLGLSLFVLSFATVLFTVLLFRLLSFFIMPSLFFDLLFIGFPIGALIAAGTMSVSRRSFGRTLWILQATMAFSVVAMLACKHFDYLRAHLFEVELHRLFIQIAVFTLFFLPFFCAYGLSEYIGYQLGRRHLRGRMPLVYALYLFGAAAAYLFAEVGFRRLGASYLMIVPFGLVALVSLLLSLSWLSRGVLVSELVALVALFGTPQMEPGFLAAYKGDSKMSTSDYTERGFQTVYQQWSKYSLVEVMKDQNSDSFAGFYNDIHQWDYSSDYGFVRPSMGVVPLENAPRGGTIAIIGSGGGRQVRYAQKSSRNFHRIVALEIDPTVVEAVNGPLASHFEHVYNHPTVELVNREARSYMEETSEKFDLIYLPSVGGYPQMMLEPGNMVRTVDACRTFRDRLTDRGVLAIWYPAGLDPQYVLTEQYIRTFAEAGLDMKVRGFLNGAELLILATRLDGGEIPTLEQVRQCIQESDKLPLVGSYLGDRPLEIEHDWKHAFFQPITDDQPFLAGNVRHIFSLRQVVQLFLLVTAAMGVFALGLFLLLRRSGNPQIPGTTYLRVVLVSLLIGANFLVIEHYVILGLFRKQYIYHEALVLGAILFLILSGLGSILITQRWRPVCQLAASLLALVLLFSFSGSPPWVNLLILLPVAFVTGSFFPALFDAAARNPLGVFAADAIGAAAGSLMSFFVPIVFGFDLFFMFATGLFWLTAVCTWLFFRKLPSEAC